MRLIDADALLNELWAGNTHTEAIKVTAVAYLINDQPTIDPRERIVAAPEKLYAYHHPVVRIDLRSAEQ